MKSNYLWLASVAMLPFFGMELLGPADLPSPSEPQYQVKFNFQDHLILAEVYLDNQGPFNFMIDTGLYPSQVSTEVARQVGLKLGPRGGNVFGLGTGQLPTYPTTLNNVKIGALGVPLVRAMAVDMSHFQTLETPIHGILGYSFLKDRVTTIDYQTQTLTFSPSVADTFRENRVQNLQKFPLQLVGGRIPLLPALKVNGQHLSAWLDTGCNATLVLSRQEVRRLDLKKAKLNVRADAVGTRGSLPIEVYYADQVTLGESPQDSVAVFAHGQAMSNLAGNELLKGYVITLDYPGRMLYLQKNP